MNAKKTACMPMSKHIFVDTEACAGCMTCELVCAARHFDGLCDRELSAIQIHADLLDYNFNYTICKQCKSASCVEACRLGAIKFDETTGARYIDKDRCVACGLCIKACPYSDEKHVPIRKVVKYGVKNIIKCDLCHGFEEGPYCVQVCPKAAIKLV